MSTSELQALFSNLRPRSQDRTLNADSPAPTSRPASSSFMRHTNVPSTPPPPFSATIDESINLGNSSMERSTTSANGATAQNLLNLLNFGGPQHSQPQPSRQSDENVAPVQPNPTALSASDLVARFMSPPVGQVETRITQDSHRNVASGSENAQEEYSVSRNPLLELLNRQARSMQMEDADDKQGQAETLVQDELSQQRTDVPEPSKNEVLQEPPVTTFDSSYSQQSTPFEPPAVASPRPPDVKGMFTYTNPFEALNASRTQTPTVATPAHQPARAATPVFKFGNNQTPTPDDAGAISARKKLTPRLRSQRSATSPQLEQTPEPAHGDASPQPEHYENTADLQPSIETPAAAQAKEIDEEEVTVKQEPKEQNIDEVVEETQEGSADWEDLPDKVSIARTVPVYNFPIKAFVSITLQLNNPSEVGIREDGVMEISRLKKEFDQLDRSLAAATSKYITYAFVKNGGMRIIRQDDGSDRHVFKNSGDRIFNVAFCTSPLNAPPSENQAILGTGVSGTVYYATVSKESNDLFEKNQLDSESLIFPPHPQADENTAGGVLKTRAKRSSRHPEFFAIGRGKSIQIVWPETAMSPRYGISESNHVVDVEKFYQDRPLQISTGKAGKDFTFSEDDTMIVSLDKTGRLRFWDIRTLVDATNATAARVNPNIIDTPLLSLSTASPAEKSWPTSVLFVDKARPYNKGGALRYVLVGLRQNHTLQLWDIALGKAVQELNFPHENETDGICSVNYHPGSGIIVVSHPTRNSIFFIHLSAPRYSISSTMSQAAFVQRIAEKDAELPKPDSTACMSGIREISFADKGQLRSVELLPIQKSTDAKQNDEASPLFELYVVHSKGVTCLGINKEDLGWNADSKVVHAIDAHQEGLVTTKELKLGSVIEETPRAKSPVQEVPQPPSKSAKKKAKKAAQASAEQTNVQEDPQAVATAVEAEVTIPAAVEVVEPEPEPIVQEVPLPKESKKNKKKSAQQTEQQPIKSEPRMTSPVKAPITSEVTTKPRDIENSSSTNNDPIAVPTEPQVPGVSQQWLEGELKKIESMVSTQFTSRLDGLYQNIQNDRALQDQASVDRQEAVLRLVSNSLNTNVEKSLSRILATQMQQVVVPVVIQSAATQIGETLKETLHQMLPNELSTHLPNAIGSAFQSPQLTRSISDAVSQRLSRTMETQITDLVVRSVTPIFNNIATSAAQRASSDTEARLSAQIKQLQLDHAADNEKLDKLSQVMHGMANTLQAMSDSQVAFQGQILKDRQTLTRSNESTVVSTSRQASAVHASPVAVARPAPVKIRSKAEIELEDITKLMNEGRYEEGSIKWLQSTQPVKLFDELFVRFTPEYLATDVSPLVAFSVAVTVANSLTHNIERRLEWIAAAFDAVDLHDSEIADLSQHAPALITSLVQKLESLYMTIAENNPTDPVLRTIPPLAKKAREVKAAFQIRASPMA